jgi:response regulator NasT
MNAIAEDVFPGAVGMSRRGGSRGATRGGHAVKGLRIMLVDDNPERLEMLSRALTSEGHMVAARLDTGADLIRAVSIHQPDVIFIDVDAPGRDTLESLGQLSREQPRPIVLFAARSDSDTTRRAVRAGVSAYVVDGMHPARLSALLEVAIARFEIHQSMSRKLEQANVRLADMRDIEKAKGLVMKRRGLDEDAAYALMRKMAMDRKQRIGELARSLISAADVL